MSRSRGRAAGFAPYRLAARVQGLSLLLLLASCGSGQQGARTPANGTARSTAPAAASTSDADAAANRELADAAPTPSASGEAETTPSDVAGPEPVLAPSFACSDASTPIERMICANPDAALLDRRMSRLYRAALGAVLPKARPAIRANQRRFLERRDGCNDVGCLVSAYDARIADLSKIRNALAEQWSDAEYEAFDPSDRETGRYVSKACDRCQQRAVSTVDMTDCNSAEIKRLTAELQRTYQRTLDLIRAVGALKDSENRWQKTLDDGCEHQAKEEFGNGTAGSIGFGNCKIAQLSRRIIWLRSGAD